MSQGTLLVTGASGQLGRRVVELLLEQGAKSIVATTRNPDKLADLAARGVTVRKADFGDEASLASAFAGVDRALLISTDDLASRAAHHKAAVRAFEAAGVKRVVYTSLTDPQKSSASVAGSHVVTEAALAESKLDFTVLRNNLYADLFLFTLPGALQRGQLVDARADGKTAFITREDCARVAAAALLERDPPKRQTLEVTGPEALSSDDVVKLVSELTGKPLAHVSVSPSDFHAALVSHGLPPEVATVYQTFDVAVAKGELSAVSDTVQRLTGRAPTRLGDFLRSVRSALTSS